MNGYLALVLALLAVIVGLSIVVFRLWRQARRIGLGLDEIAEDALKALYHLSREEGPVREADLIRAADLRPARFGLVWAEIARRGWARNAEGTLQILPPGERRAVDLIRAHRLWERYLAEREGLALDSLHAEASRREIGRASCRERV